MSYSTASRIAQARAQAAASEAAASEAKKVVVSSSGEFQEEPIDSVRVDAMVVMKIVRHAQQTGPSSSFSAGQLLGLDTAGLLEVSDSYAFPPNHVFPISEASEERDYNRGRREDGFDQAAVNAHNYTAQFLPRLAELNADANVVGFYATTSNGQVSGQNGALIEALARYQSGTASEPTTAVAKLRAKAPERKGPGKGIALVYDASSSTSETVSLRAFRLTDAYLAVHRAGKYDTHSLAEHQTTPNNILREFPVTITRSSLLAAFLTSLAKPTTDSRSGLLPAPTLSTLSLPSSKSPHSSGLSQPLQALLTSFDASLSAINNLRFKDRRGAKNANPESHLEALKNLAAADGAASSLSESTAIEISRLYGARAVQV